ncbi:hypothetical protein F0P96_14070 [Hymenobacter busanensis]|uniref:Uncharacterized protein n=1 Tax=Hymenobacter busanensis TaxID=2607656 RepID=A0A7L5A262_9BACT|nr:hypothetical protein [Hymenobacter busanensis]KAA9331369.1 hypothetical protein F0P96_14070 [Hymenobacter busanensis]QHJ08522.1 hypothetical protein GUY19_14995 [Hymenobacter busanensis]
MRKFSLFLFLLVAACGSAQVAQAQVTINIAQPSWGPAVPAGAQYYYVPEYGGYYDLRAQRYIVQRDGKWQRLVALDGYNPSSFHPVVIDYIGASPWVRISEHKTKYGHPHGMPPGQAKKMRGTYVAPASGVIVVDDRGGKAKGHGNGNGNGKGHGKGKH